MPTDYVTIVRVMAGPTVKPGLIRYDVNASLVDARLGLSYETIDPWIASLCQRAQDTQQPMALTWKDGRYGKQIVQVRLMSDGDVAFQRELAADRKGVA